MATESDDVQQACRRYHTSTEGFFSEAFGHAHPQVPKDLAVQNHLHRYHETGKIPDFVLIYKEFLDDGQKAEDLEQEVQPQYATG